MSTINTDTAKIIIRKLLVKGYEAYIALGRAQRAASMSDSGKDYNALTLALKSLDNTLAMLENIADEGLSKEDALKELRGFNREFSNDISKLKLDEKTMAELKVAYEESKDAMVTLL